MAAAPAEDKDGSAPSDAHLDRIAGALWGLYIGDALAMPTHWYYGGSGQVMRDYGEIKGYVKPKKELQGSIMNLSSTGGGGRGSDKGEIIGKVINHDKKEFWTARGSYHYHCTLEAGENTLEAQLARLVTKQISDCGGKFDADEMRQRYIDFMTTPGTHNDCYASTCHRMFFANLTNGLPPEQCPDNDNHNVDTIDGLVLTVPVVLASYAEKADTARGQAAKCTSVTRNSQELQKYAGEFANVLHNVLSGTPIKEALDGYEASGPDPVVAWYLRSSYPSLNHFAAKYGDDFETALLANANCGGENVHRGCVLGALLGAAHGESGIPQKLKDGLKDAVEIRAEIDAFKASLIQRSAM